MKKYLFLVLPVFVFAVDAPPMPPMIPNMGHAKTVTHKKHSNSLPNSCEIIPPMIYKLPPPLENALRKCKNDLYKPSLSMANKKFKNSIKSIVPLENFSQIYKITFSNKKLKSLYCNQDLTFCFNTAPTKR